MRRAPYTRANPVSYVERLVRKMLIGFNVWFRHHGYVGGREVDFLIPRPGRRGLILEVDGDIWHVDLEKKERRDRMIRAEGWEIIHFWGSEVLQTPKIVAKTIEAELEGVPRLPPPEKRGQMDNQAARLPPSGRTMTNTPS